MENNQDLKDELHQDEDLARQFVTFRCNNEMFAVPMAPVQEIIRMPQVVQVPLAPNSLLGLANLRGHVLPIVSLRRFFNYEDVEADDATRVLVINLGTPIGFVVDQVTSVNTVEPQQMDDTSGIQATVNAEFLSGVIKDVGQYAMVMVLNFERLIKTEFSAITQRTAQKSGSDLAGQVQTETRQNASDEELQLVSFTVAEQEYAIVIEQVQEIVQVPENISRVPHAQSHVVGVMTLRSRLLPLVNLRKLFGLPSGELSEHNRIVVIALDDSGLTSVGVVMDTVNEVLRVPSRLVDNLPPMLARNANLVEVSSICRLDEGKRLVSILSAEKMFNQSVLEDLRNVTHHQQLDTDIQEEQDGRAQTTTDDDEQFVVFRLASEEYGVPIEAVQEIVRVPEALSFVPRAPAFIEGVINLRGAVLPVVDQRTRFGMPRTERNDRQRIMVFAVGGVLTGFIVDSVSEVLRLPAKLIEKAPSLSEEQSRIIKRVANVQAQQRMILLLDTTQLLDAEELVALADVN